MSSASEWTRQLDRLSRHTMGQRSFMNWFQHVTGCSDKERDTILWEQMGKARRAMGPYVRHIKR